MDPVFTRAVIVFVVLYAAIIGWELLSGQSSRSVTWQTVALVAAVAVLRATTGFPIPRQSFGGFAPILAIGLMLLCVIVGIAARYIFYLRGKFAWLQLAKPLVISPIVLLPLIGSVPTNADVEDIQLISLALLSFQNGFFWVAVLESARTVKSTPGQ